MRVAVIFTNLGPYHLARLRALADWLSIEGDELIVYEVARREKKYPWESRREPQSFTWITLYADRALETLTSSECRSGMRSVLDRDLPDVIAVCGYVRPESTAAAIWARQRGVPVVLMSESQAIDRPRVWWKETLKRHRLRLFDAALVGGPRHRDYLIQLGMSAGRIAFGYNAVDNARFENLAVEARRPDRIQRNPTPRPYFLSVARFVPEKNLVALIRAYAHYKSAAPPDSAWDLVLCGSGVEGLEIENTARSASVDNNVHLMGFVHDESLARAYAGASAFILPSLSEPWGLVANEAAACGLPLLVSDRCGCADTLVADPPGTTGLRFDPSDDDAITRALTWISTLPETERQAIGQRAAAVVSEWGPERFAKGLIEAIKLAAEVKNLRRAKSSRLRRTEWLPQ